MEWTNRGGQPPAAAAHNGGRKSKKTGFFSLRTASIALLLAIVILVLALLSYLVVGNPSSEKKYVEGDKMQAVFLNGGQVYFGHIRNLNEEFIRLTDIYYLRVTQQVQPDQDTKKSTTAPVLVPLGCELHRPQNEMIINRDQVVFWENLKDDQPENTVPGAVAKFQADNPNGQKCTDTSTNK